MKSYRSLIPFALAFTLAACSDEPSNPSENNGDQVRLSVTGDTEDGTLVLDPRTATLHVGYGMLVTATITNVSGQPIEGARPSWRSTNASIVAVTALPDTGSNSEGRKASIRAIAEGTAMIIASRGVAADTAFVTVAPPRIDSTGHGGGAPVPTATEFELGIYVSTAFDSTLLAQWVREPVANATVKLYRLPPQPGDTIPVAVTPVNEPTLFQTAQTNAEGFVKITNIPMGPFRVEVTPPTDSDWEPKTVNFATPYFSSVRQELRLTKN